MRKARRIGPGLDARLDPCGNGHGAYVATLSDKVRNYPVLLPLLNGFQRQCDHFAPAQAAANKHRYNSVIAQSTERKWGIAMEEAPALFHGQPIAQSEAEAADRFHAPNACGQLRAKEPGVGGFIGDASDRRESEIDRIGRIVPLFEVDAKSRTVRSTACSRSAL